MTRGLDIAVVAGAVACGAAVSASAIDSARRVGREVPATSQDAMAAVDESREAPHRDPFVRPVHTPSVSSGDERPAGDGLAAAPYDEVVVRGVVQTRGDRVALVQTPDGRHYRVRAGDRLRDGRVQAVGAGGLLIVPDTRAGAVRGGLPVRKPIGADSGTRAR